VYQCGDAIANADSVDLETDLGERARLGVGEPPLIACGPAIMSAIFDAIGKPVRTLPATPERVWRTMAEG
jgi:CO/xanthine dehydrogenase Mo-binding subunit